MARVLFGERLFEPGLIIFDKDGTLTDFRKIWIPLLNKRVELVHKFLGLNMPLSQLMERMYRVFGINEHRIDPYGPFPYSPPWEDEIIFATVLYELGVPYQKGKIAAHKSLIKAEEELDRIRLAELYDGVKEVLEALKKSGIYIALATADLTHIANDTLKHVGIYDLFDYVVGADMVEKDKPDPEMVNMIIEALNVNRKHVAIVGDTITDMEMGRKADVGLVVGVTEGGIATRKDLEKDADVVLESVREIRVV
jgi:phosphoglycolate phosphatase